MICTRELRECVTLAHFARELVFMKKIFAYSQKKKTRTTFTSSSRHVEINDKQTILYMKITTMYTPDK